MVKPMAAGTLNALKQGACAMVLMLAASSAFAQSPAVKADAAPVAVAAPASATDAANTAAPAIENNAKADAATPVAAPAPAAVPAAPSATAGKVDAAASLPQNPPVLGHATPWQWRFQAPGSPVMDRLEPLHDGITIAMAVIVVLVMGLLAWIAIRFREKANPVASKTTHNTLLEIAWTTIPILILIAIAVPSVKLHYFMAKPEKPEMVLKVEGHQWYWHFEYPDQGNFGFDSNMILERDLPAGKPRLLTVDNPLVVPVDTTIQVLVTGADVIHSFAMPAMGLKTDGIPGRMNESWFRAEHEGIYYGQCSELCGVNHGFMPVELHVVSKEAFRIWAAQAAKQFASNGAPRNLFASAAPLSIQE